MKKKEANVAKAKKNKKEMMKKKVEIKKSASAKKSTSTKKATPKNLKNPKKVMAITKTKKHQSARSVEKVTSHTKSVQKMSYPSQKVQTEGMVTPLDDRVIIQILESEKVTPGGLIIPDTAQGNPGNKLGIVLSVGKGHRNKQGKLKPMDVKVGDKVVFSEYKGSKIQHQGKELVILRESDVMGILD